MEEFKKEVREMSTADILLILADQLDLYSEEEIQILRAELDSRPENALQLEEDEQQRLEELNAQAEEARKQQEARKRVEAALEQQRVEAAHALQNKKDALRDNGYDGYYEYKVISLSDDSDGGIASHKIEALLNQLGLEGWRLRSSYTNELGKNSSSNGFGGYSSGTNATIDQHLLVFERFVRLDRT